MNSSRKICCGACIIIISIAILGYTPCKFVLQANPQNLFNPLSIESKQLCSYALTLESLTIDHYVSPYSYRSSGSPGAKTAAYWISEVLKDLGLRVETERFLFITWELIDKPSLTLYMGSESIELKSFTSTHLSWPTSESGVRKEIKVYGDDYEVDDSVLIVGIDELTLHGELTDLFNFIKTHKPKAVLYTNFYIFNKWTPYVSFSVEGKKFWDVEVPTGWISYDDWIFVKKALNAGNKVEVEMKIPARMGYGPHYNVVGELDGISNNKVFIVSAHYDTVMTPGFIDNGAGVAGTLTIAKAFIEAYKTGWKAPFRIRFVFFTAEEFGLVGSLHYISEHKSELENIIGVINLDSIGGLRLKVLNSSSILNELALEAAEELDVPHTEKYNIFSFLNHNSNLQTAADHLSFENPKSALLLAKSNWPELNLSIDSSVSIPAITVSSRPIYSSYIRTGEKPCWIHTLFDNSSTPGWTDENRLKQHVEVSALTICKAMKTAVLRGTLSTYMIFLFESIFQLLPVDRDIIEAEFIEKTKNAN